MSKTTVVYKDVAPGADYASTITSSDAQSFSQLDKIPFGVEADPIITCEHNMWLLDGTFRTIETEDVSFWSTEMSGDDCTLQMSLRSLFL